MVNKAGMVPAFKSCTLRPDGEFSKAIQEWAGKGKIYAWQQNEMPNGFGQNTLGPIFHQMASGQINPVIFARLFSEAVGTIK
jgi:raffinose/stachyose/melibiose transport system substrate-binding protein